MFSLKKHYAIAKFSSFLQNERIVEGIYTSQLPLFRMIFIIGVVVMRYYLSFSANKIIIL